MWTSKIKKPSLFVLLASLLFACGVHIYLTQQHYITKYSALQGSQLCNISDYLSCSTAIASSYSEFMGIPLGIFGLFTNLIILFFVLRFLLSKDNHSQRVNAVGALSFALISVIASIVMAAISFGVLNSLCPFCFVSYILSFIIFFTCWQVVGSQFVLNLPKQITSLCLAVVFFFGASFVTGKIVANKYQVKDVSEMVQLGVSAWANREAKDVQPVAPFKEGPDGAAMKIVEFADFLCIHCKMSFSKLHLFLKTHKDVQLQFQAFPLDGCPGDIENPGKRCQLAMLNLCAAEQNKPWEAQAYLFETQEDNYNKDFKNILDDLAIEVSLNKENLQACMKKPETLQTIKDQLKHGQDLGIEGTPGFFINNKSFPGAGNLPTLEALYQHIKSS